MLQSLGCPGMRNLELRLDRSEGDPSLTSRAGKVKEARLTGWRVVQAELLPCRPLYCSETVLHTELVLSKCESLLQSLLVILCIS